MIYLPKPCGIIYKTGAKNKIELHTNTTVAKFFTFSLGANIDNVATTKTISKNLQSSYQYFRKIWNKNLTGYSIVFYICKFANRFVWNVEIW